MDKNLPDKWIRKAIFDAFNGTIVDGKTINVFDSRQSADDIAVNNAYVLMASQSNNVNETKSGDYYVSTIRLEVIVFYNSTGNPGSRLLADNIIDELRSALNPQISLDLASGRNVISQNFNFVNDVVTPSVNKSIFRKILDLTFTID